MQKQYYSGDIKVQKFALAIQGYQTKQFYNDLMPALHRLVRFIDISKNVDPKRTFLPYLQGIDQIRNQKHGRLKIDINKSYVEIWPIRRINRFEQPLTIELFDLEYEQATKKKRDGMGQAIFHNNPVTLQHLLCLRNMVVSRYPLKQFESALCNLPLFEL